MFYGGRLLNHLTFRDPEVEDFISLRCLNRFIAILIDSDREKSGQRLNRTKLRVLKEFNEDGPGFAWVTQGREIENYLPADLVEGAIRQVHQKVWKVLPHGRYNRALEYKPTRTADPKEADKIKVARQVVQEPADLSRLDLEKQIKRVVQFIREANEV